MRRHLASDLVWLPDYHCTLRVFEVGARVAGWTDAESGPWRHPLEREFSIRRRYAATRRQRLTVKVAGRKVAI
jgi:hypothetical protein